MHCYRPKALLVAACLLSAIPGHGADAQTPDEDQIDIPVFESGEQYRKSLGRTRLKSDLIYLRPEADETLPREAAKPEPPKEPEDLSRTVLIAVTVAILIAIGIFAFQFAPKATITMSAPDDRTREGGRRRQRAQQASQELTAKLAGREFLDELRRMSDRKAALILLLKRALERALEINGMTLGRSQTAREILRKLPRSWDHYPALSRIVGFEERVQFGGHDLPEPVFQESLSLAEPLFIQEPAR